MQRISERKALIAMSSDPFAGDIRLPATYQEAIKGIHAEYWKRALKTEIRSLRKHKVYKLVDKRSLPKRANIISAKWVFKVKPNPDGTIERFKCRLCARGFLQKEGIDYLATFSPVANSASIKLLLALAAKGGLQLRQADVSTAFLYGKLPKSERVYVTCPEGIDHEPGQVMELRRCIYGLKQASRRWFEKLRNVLTRAGYKPTKSDPCLYRRFKNGEETLVAVVVDDLLIASTTDRGTKRVIRSLRKTGLETKDLGHPEYVVGMHVRKHKNGDVSINQRLYIETLLRRFNMEEARGADTPANPTVKLSDKLTPQTKEEQAKMSKIPYRQLVGALLYVLLTRPDCAVAVGELTRFMSNPGKAMWTAAKRVLRYLKATMHVNVRFKARSQNKRGHRTRAHVDASHAADPDKRRSRCGHVIEYNGTAILWRSIMQKRVALSTAEAEYRALTYAVKDIMWLRNILAELGRRELAPTPINEDNRACIAMVENPIVSARNKFIELDCHFVRDHQQMQHVRMVEVDTANQVADMMTKNLPGPAFRKHRSTILDD